jgi:hypothetical protein
VILAAAVGCFASRSNSSLMLDVENVRHTADLTNIYLGMSDISSNVLGPVFSALGEQLASRGSEIHLVVIGGSGRRRASSTSGCQRALKTG